MLHIAGNVLMDHIKQLRMVKQIFWKCALMQQFCSQIWSQPIHLSNGICVELKLAVIQQVARYRPPNPDFPKNQHMYGCHRVPQS